MGELDDTNDIGGTDSDDTVVFDEDDRPPRHMAGTRERTGAGGTDPDDDDEDDVDWRRAVGGWPTWAKLVAPLAGAFSALLLALVVVAPGSDATDRDVDTGTDQPETIRSTSTTSSTTSAAPASSSSAAPSSTQPTATTAAPSTSGQPTTPPPPPPSHDNPATTRPPATSPSSTTPDPNCDPLGLPIDDIFCRR